MQGITITARTEDNLLAVDLIDILRLLGSDVEGNSWEISQVECVGSDAEALHQIADSETRVSGMKLFEIASNLMQVIYGTFKAYRLGESIPWIVIRAVDSSAYDVETQDEAVLDRIRNSFTQVTDLPS
jgi:hypothetical protein